MTTPAARGLWPEFGSGEAGFRSTARGAAAEPTGWWPASSSSLSPPAHVPGKLDRSPDDLSARSVGQRINQPHTSRTVRDRPYHRLYEIEASFRMSKHDLAARPIYHQLVHWSAGDQVCRHDLLGVDRGSLFYHLSPLG